MSNSTKSDHFGESGLNASPRLSQHEQRPIVEDAYAWLVSKLALYLEIDPSDIDSHESFANYGLGSADAVSLSGELEEWLACEVSPTIAYDYPTIDALARFIARPPLTVEQPTVNGGELAFTSEPIAIIGMACRFPGESNTPEAFWQLLRQGKDALSTIPAERWDVDAFYDPDPAAQGKMYTRYGCFVQDMDRFDAQFFGIVPREALRMDPQQRLLVEVAWEALENAGLPVHSLAGSQTGVFLGMMNTYEYAQLQIQRDNASSMSYVDDPYFNMGSASSIAAGRVAYLFDLQGPTLTVDTACSSSLVSVHLACQSLRNKECNLAMVGGVNAITLPENMVNACKMGMLAPDGRCKTFDATADGFVLGEGCGMVILKRLSEAVESKDTILAIIRGSAVNQDGHSNGITAPNGLSQEAVIRTALQRAGLEPQQISYVEAHGSGTSLGDPIEVKALEAVLGAGRAVEQPLLIGSVKTNIGHLAGAAGIAGLIKTVLALQHKELPPHLHLKNLNPHMLHGGQPSRIAIPTQVTPWHTEQSKRFAGVSSFGWSGTNAHVIVEEAPTVEIAPTSSSSQSRLLVLSAKTETALEQATDNLVAYLRQNTQASLVDAAYTLQTGRSPLHYRRFLLCQEREEALHALETRDVQRVLNGTSSERQSVAFLFPGLGEQYAGMAQELYREEPKFRETIDACLHTLKTRFGVDLYSVLFPTSAMDGEASATNGKHNGHNGHNSHTPHAEIDLRVLLGRDENAISAAAAQVQQTALAQPLTFIIEYALARLLQQWGIQPRAMLGYSLGEYVAACLSGVFSLDDALFLVTKRAQLIQEQPVGTMLAVALSEEQAQQYVSEQLSLAAVNGATTCVLAGPTSAVEQLEAQLRQQEIVSRRVATTHAFHSTMLEPIRQQFINLLQSVTFHPPQIPYLSNVTGTWITKEQATDPTYWAQHMCQTVRFSDSVEHLLQETSYALLEVGPGQSLASFVKQHRACQRERMAAIISLLPSSYERQAERTSILTALGRLWLVGVEINWTGLYEYEQRRRLVLPTYPFERQRYWIDALPGQRPEKHVAQVSGKKSDSAEWFYLPEWERSSLPVNGQHEQLMSKRAVQHSWLLFVTDAGPGEQIAEHLRQAGHAVVCVHVGEQFAQSDENVFSLRPHVAGDYTALLDTLKRRGQLPLQIVHMWSCTTLDESLSPVAIFQRSQQLGLYSLLYLAQALGVQENEETTHITVMSQQTQAVTGFEALHPAMATVSGACRVIPQEYPTLFCRHIDLAETMPVAPLLAEILAQTNDVIVAYRNNERWIQTFKPLRLEQPDDTQIGLRERGVYMLTGGLGGLGLVLSEYLAQAVHARLVMVGRSPLLARDEWQNWLKTHDVSDSTSQKIQAIQKLETLGAEVLVLQANVADEEQMRQAVQQAHAHFGVVHGVIHAAGIFDEQAFGVIQEIDPVAVCEAHFQPKAYGLLALERALEGYPLDFCVLFSSLVSVLGGLGFIGYTAANTFMDVYAHKHNQSSPVHWTSLGWDIWHVKEERHGVHRYGVLGSTVDLYAMTAVEGVSTFARMLSQRGNTHIINSTGDLQERIRKWIRLESIRERKPHATKTSATHMSSAESTNSSISANEEYERIIAAIIQEELGLEQVGLYDNFFDLGGNSLLGLQVIARLKKEFRMQIPAVALFEAPTVSTLAHYLLSRVEKRPDSQQQVLKQRRKKARQSVGQEGIAIIGMTGRFPGAATIEQFWQNLRAGVESITFFSDEELIEAGVDPEKLKNPDYVKARPIIEHVDQFDAAFFGYSPREAELTDPQHRLFLECAWEAFEHAGYDPLSYDGLVGVYGGTNLSTYLLGLVETSDILHSTDGYQIAIGNDKDSLTTTVSYKLNLKGPSFAIQTFCSTSLVATHLACQSLLQGECDMALAGGASLRVPTKNGYLYQEGGMDSPTGHCYTFDARAKGSIFGDGVGIVVLKRLSDALADGDTIHAVIKGSAINNDGSLKVSYSAPSVPGQAEVVMTALRNAGVNAESIGYIEAHGTATELGDPIEMAALTKAFGSHTDKTGYCAIGSVKTNIGHLDRAAGVSGLMKTVLALQHEEIPPSLHFETPNPEIDFEHSPFYVNTKLSPWKRNGIPRRAGVNSLGMGGTNAHIVLEEAPLQPASSPSRPWQILPLSAKTPSALETMTNNLYEYIQRDEKLNLADVAHTLQVGRSAFNQRRLIVFREREDLLHTLQTKDAQRILTAEQVYRNRPVAFLFPGIGEQYAGMAQELYQEEPTFKATVDTCFAFLKQKLHLDIQSVLYPANQQTEGNGQNKQVAQPLDLRVLLGRGNVENTANEPLKQTVYAQPAVFIVEYALAQLLLQWGIRPQAMLGYSLGEYVAACVAGVLSLEDALTLVARRAQLIQTLPQGAMLAVFLAEKEILPYLNEQVSLAVINGPTTCVLAGPIKAIKEVESRLSQQEIACRRVETTHAFHSAMMEPVCDALTELARGITLHAPQIPYLSNVTGTWITAEQVTNPTYWAQHMCQTVRFGDGIAHLLEEPERLLLEVGSGQTLCSFVKQHPACERERMHRVLATLPAQFEQQSASYALLKTLGKLWLSGVSINWAGFYSHERRRRIPLPTYPFERKSYWIEPKKASHGMQKAQMRLDRGSQRISNTADWFFLPSWKQTLLPPTNTKCTGVPEQRRWLVFVDDCGCGTSLVEQLVRDGQQIISVLPGNSFSKRDTQTFTVRPSQRTDYEALFNELQRQGSMPTDVVHLWTVTERATSAINGNMLEETLDTGFYSLLALSQALGNLDVAHCAITVISNELQDVTGNEQLNPAKATVMGPCRVIAQEYSNLSCRSIDIVLPETAIHQEVLSRQLLRELDASITDTVDPVVALRGKQRWVQTFEPAHLADQPLQAAALREGGVYLITGGLGGIGLAMAEYLAMVVNAKLVLVGRKALPPQHEWSSILTAQDDTPLARQMRKVLELEELGIQVLVLQADVTSETEMRGVVQQTLSTFGELHGIFHMAGVPGVGLMQLKTREQASKVLAPKVQGTLVLERVVQHLTLDFLVLFSSMTSTIGGPGQVDYCAANSFLDAYAHQQQRNIGLTVAIDWGEWQWNAWEDGLGGYDATSQDFFKENRRTFGISFSEGTEALMRVLAAQLSHVVVATQDFGMLIELGKTFTTSAVLQLTREQQQDRVMHPRPTLGSSYVPAKNDLERQIVTLWEELLGVTPIGINDNFFELGGNSLTGVDLIARMKKTLSLENLPAYVLYEAPSVGALARHVEQRKVDAGIEGQKERGARRREGLRQRMRETGRAR